MRVFGASYAVLIRGYARSCPETGTPLRPAKLRKAPRSRGPRPVPLPCRRKREPGRQRRGRSQLVHLEGLGISHRDARSRGIPGGPPAATPADLCAPLVTESCGRSVARWRSEALGGAAEPLRQRLRVGREFGIPDALAVSRTGRSQRHARPGVAVIVAWREVCCDAIMPGRRAASRPSPRCGRGAGRRGRGLSAPWRVAGCRSSSRRW